MCASYLLKQIQHQNYSFDTSFSELEDNIDSAATNNPCKTGWIKCVCEQLQDDALSADIDITVHLKVELIKIVKARISTCVKTDVRILRAVKKSNLDLTVAILTYDDLYKDQKEASATKKPTGSDRSLNCKWEEYYKKIENELSAKNINDPHMTDIAPRRKGRKKFFEDPKDPTTWNIITLQTKCRAQSYQ